MGVLAAAETGVWQLRTALPFRCTVHAPHWPIPQPNLVPFSFRTSRITHNRGMSAGTSTVLDCPFTVSWKAMTVGLLSRIRNSYHICFSSTGCAPVTLVCYRRHCSLYINVKEPKMNPQPLGRSIGLGRCIGSIGGLGVGAAVHYYQELAKMHTARGRVLNLVMAHADMTRVRGAVEAQDKPGLATYLAGL